MVVLSCMCHFGTNDAPGFIIHTLAHKSHICKRKSSSILIYSDEEKLDNVD